MRGVPVAPAPDRAELFNPHDDPYHTMHHGQHVYYNQNPSPDPAYHPLVGGELMSRTRYQNAKAQNEEMHPFMYEAWKSLGRCFGGWGGCICLFLLFGVVVLIWSAITG